MNERRLRRQSLIIEVFHWLSIALFLAYVLIFLPSYTSRENVVILACVAAIYFLLLHRLLPSLITLEKKLTIEPYLDVLMVTLILAFTGFLLSPFFFLYFLVLLGELLVRGPREIYPQTVYITAVYLLLSFLQPGGAWAQADILARILVNLGLLWLGAYYIRNLRTIAIEEEKED